jgi:large subunit ribosomal protein L24
MQKIRQGDLVVVLTGKDKGKQGNVSRRIDENTVIVDGVNLVTKALKANPNKGIEGGLVQISLPIQISNIAVVNPETNKADRIGFSIIDGKKVRVFKSNGKTVN